MRIGEDGGEGGGGDCAGVGGGEGGGGQGIVVGHALLFLSLAHSCMPTTRYCAAPRCLLIRRWKELKESFFQRRINGRRIIERLKATQW